SFGSVISKLRSDARVRDGLPSYVYLGDANHAGGPGFLGKAHEAYLPGQRGSANLGLCRDVSLDRLGDRRALLATFDDSRGRLGDVRASREGMDAFTDKAMEMLTPNRARDAFDLSREPERVRQCYGRGVEYLTARRLVEAGVPVVTITPQNHNVPKDC